MYKVQFIDAGDRSSLVPGPDFLPWVPIPDKLIRIKRKHTDHGARAYRISDVAYMAATDDPAQSEITVYVESVKG